MGERSGKWAKATYNGKTGWVNLDFAKKVSGPPDEQVTGEGVAYRATETLNLRAKATVSSELLLKIPKGTKITVGEQSGKWGKTTYNGKTGWVNLDFAERVTGGAPEETPEETPELPEEEPETPATGDVYQATTTLNLRAKATADSTLLLKIPEGTKVTVGERSGSWAKTTYNGKTGWVNLNFAKKVSGSGSAGESETPPSGESEEPSSGTVYRVTADLSLRADKSTSSKRLLVIPDGTKVIVTKVSGGWGKTTYKGQTGWISLDYAKKVTGSSESGGSSGTAYKTTADLSLRADKSTSSKRLLVIPDGAKITVTEVSGGWGKTSYGGKTGWVSMDYVRKS